MKIQFLLTEPTLHIVGGYKMVFQYSNFMVENGDEVDIYYLCKDKSYIDSVVLFLRWLIMKRGIKWYRLNNRIRQHVLGYNKVSKISTADVCIVTASSLLPIVYNSKKSQKIIHFIQDHEIWTMSEDKLFDIYKIPVPKIVVSHWLYELVKKYTEYPVEIVSNGINLETFKITTPIGMRDDMTLMMLYHQDSRKGCNRGIEIIKRAKLIYPQLKCIMFGSPKRSERIPSWIDYKRNVKPSDLAKLYNRTAIFISPSYFEGFGLTGLESMACGCALVSTDTKGVREYANRKNALLSDPENDEALYQSLIALLNDSSLRIKIASLFQQERGNYSSQKKSALFSSIIHNC